MILGPIMAIGGIVALFVVLGIPIPDPSLLGWPIGIAAFWALSLVLFPEKKHKICKGTGAYGMMGMLRTCGGCEGTGRIKRIGAGQ